MKHLKLLILTSVTAITLALAISPANAMGDSAPSSINHPSKSVDKKLDKLTSALSLSTDEQAKVKVILEQEVAEVKELHNNKALSKADHAAKLKAIHAETKTKIAALLSADQQKKFADMGPGHRSSAANKG